jgi:hypothetical protein
MIKENDNGNEGFIFSIFLLSKKKKEEYFDRVLTLLNLFDVYSMECKLVMIEACFELD